ANVLGIQARMKKATENSMAASDRSVRKGEGMATRTQIRFEGNSADPVPTANSSHGPASAAAARSERTACIHEQGLRSSYSRHRARIHSLCVWMSPNLDHARDLLQLVFLNACRLDAGTLAAGNSFDAGRDTTTASPQALESLQNLHASFARHFSHLFTPEGAPARPHLLGPTPPSDLRAAVLSLPASQRLLYLLHEVEGCSVADLAAWLRTDAVLCARLLHAARLQLRLFLLAA